MKACLSVLILALAGTCLVGAENPDVGETGALPSPEYMVGIEDVLRIVVWNEPNLSLSVAVRPDGNITLPLANDIKVAGLSPHEIRDTLTRRLSGFIRDPNVTVIVEQINSFRIFILGEVNQQGIQSFRRPTRLLQAIASAGGLTEFSKKEAAILREDEGTEKRLRIDLKRLLAGESPEQNSFLKPNDTILVF